MEFFKPTWYKIISAIVLTGLPFLYYSLASYGRAIGQFWVIPQAIVNIISPIISIMAILAFFPTLFNLLVVWIVGELLSPLCHYNPTIANIVSFLSPFIAWYFICCVAAFLLHILKKQNTHQKT